MPDQMDINSNIIAAQPGSRSSLSHFSILARPGFTVATKREYSSQWEAIVGGLKALEKLCKVLFLNVVALASVRSTTICLSPFFPSVANRYVKVTKCPLY